MAFDEEPSVYKKTVLSDLQGAWQNLRDTVVEHAGFSGWERALLHIDEGMSWESVRNLRSMSKCLLLVRNILAQGDVPGEVALWVEEVNRVLDEALQALREGDRLSCSLGVDCVSHKCPAILSLANPADLPVSSGVASIR
jgi:hypothetical protein